MLDLFGRRGRQRLWDLGERVYSADMPARPADAARKVRDERRLRSLGVARPQIVGEAGTSAEVEGTSGLWRVDPEATAEDFKGRTAVLWPFDRLIHDRVRAKELFDLQVHAVHPDVRFTRNMTAAVHAELEALAQWLGLDDVRFVTQRVLDPAGRPNASAAHHGQGRRPGPEPA